MSASATRAPGRRSPPRLGVCIATGPLVTWHARHKAVAPLFTAEPTPDVLGDSPPDLSRVDIRSDAFSSPPGPPCKAVALVTAALNVALGDNRTDDRPFHQRGKDATQVRMSGDEKRRESVDKFRTSAADKLDEPASLVGELIRRRAVAVDEPPR